MDASSISRLCVADLRQNKMPRITQVENISSEAMLPTTMQGGRLAV
ncbi:MAG: hypothetical protein IIB76_11200 [Proteobacteria bacterium]|nr:hypothetical protein [Pseudomonadota bacterium]